MAARAGKQLTKLVENKTPLPEIAKTLGRSVEAVRQKIVRLGLVVDGQKKKNRCSSTTTAQWSLHSELFSVEDVLRELHAAVMKLETLRLDKIELAAMNYRRCFGR